MSTPADCTIPKVGLTDLDRQVSIPDPTPENPNQRAMIDCFGVGTVYEIDAKGSSILFTWSPMFGPCPETKRGDVRELGPRHPFWRAASLWHLQSRRTDGTKAIWHEPKGPVLKHLGGRNYEVIEDAEPGYDW